MHKCVHPFIISDMIMVKTHQSPICHQLKFSCSCRILLAYTLVASYKLVHKELTKHHRWKDKTLGH